MAEADASIAGFCGVCFYASLSSWCIFHPFGADVRCCGGQRGCCGSCCDDSFNEDDFDDRMRKERERNDAERADNGAYAKPVDGQPEPSQRMSVVADDPKQPETSVPV